MEKTVRIYLIFDRGKKVKAPNDKGLIEYYIYFPQRTKTYYSTGVSVTASEWDSKNKQLHPTTPEAMEMNQYFKDQINSIMTYSIELIKQGKSLNKTNLKSFMNEDEAESFNEFAWRALKKKKVALSTYTSQRRSLNVFEELAGNISFQELTLDLIESITYDMFHDYDYSPGTVWRVHKDIKIYVNRAMRLGIIPYHQNPYILFKNKAPAAKHEYLNYEELAAIENTSMPGGELQIVKDAFLFSCYTGLRFSDLRLLDGDKLKENEDGTIDMTLKRMVKVDQRIFQRLNVYFDGKAQKLIRPYLKRYGKEKNIWGKTLYNSDCNKLLKVIVADAKIKKHVTMHMGRHTFGTIMTRETDSIPLVMKLMGIAQHKTASVYINLSDELYVSNTSRNRPPS